MGEGASRKNQESPLLVRLKGEVAPGLGGGWCGVWVGVGGVGGGGGVLGGEKTRLLFVTKVENLFLSRTLKERGDSLRGKGKRAAAQSPVHAIRESQENMPRKGGGPVVLSRR